MLEWLRDNVWSNIAGETRAAAWRNIISKRVVWLGVIGILLIAAGNVFDNASSGSNAAPDRGVAKESDSAAPRHAAGSAAAEESVLEDKIRKLLTNVRGAGKVSVSVSLEGGSIDEHAQNTVRETKIVEENTGGGTRTTSESKENSQVLLVKDSGSDKPVMVRQTRPVIKGVLVIAEGAGDSQVKAYLTEAVATGLGIASYKITVLPQAK